MSGLSGLFGRSYDTRLGTKQEDAFQRWARANNRLSDLQDYDLRGAWLASAQQANNGHLPDTYKKPNHPTFSDESQYSTPQMQGGSWTPSGNDQWTFWASPQNMQTSGIRGLADYFQQVEPGNTVIFPLDYRLPRK